MSDWVYIVGEGGFNQDFLIRDRETGDPLDLDGAVVTMFIQTTDGVTDFPTGGTLMTVVGDPDAGTARLVVQNTFMPQSADMYSAQIQIQTTSLVKTFIIDLRVIRSMSS